MREFLSWLLVLFSFLGLLDASYLTYQKVTGFIPPCTAGFACETVITSKYSLIGPIPLVFFGVAYYGLILLITTLVFLEKDHVKILGKLFHTSDLLWISLGGLCVSLYLIFIMGVVLKAWCIYCLFSALMCFLIVGTTFVYWNLYRKACVCEASYFRRTVLSILYTRILKPFFFLLDAEFVHTRMLKVGEWLGDHEWTRSLTAWMFMTDPHRKSFTVDGISFRSRVGLSAGFDYEACLTQILPSLGFGFMTIGTITYLPFEGNPKPRLARFPQSKALLVNKGFLNPGAQEIIARLKGKKFQIPVGISIGSTNIAFPTLHDRIIDVVSCFKLFENAKLSYIYYELNISCPNTTQGQPFLEPFNFRKLLVALHKLHIKRPIYIKMPIDLSHSETLSLLRVADTFPFICGVIFGNLTKDKNNPDITAGDRAKWKEIQGNLSGKPTFARSNNLIAFTHSHFGKRFTIIGTGGIFTPQDTLIKLQKGASLVQLITGMIYEGPQLINQINDAVRMHDFQ